MATSALKRKPTKNAMDTLHDSINGLVESAAENMTAEELLKAERKINEIADRAVAAHKRRRETA